MGTDKKQAGLCLGKPSGASESDSLASELADAPVSESLSRFAIGPAFRALREILGMGKRMAQGCDWLANRGDVLGKHLQARLRVSLQNSSGIRATNHPWVFRGIKLVRPHPS